MHARRPLSLALIAAALFGASAAAQVPGLGAPLAGLLNSVVWSTWNPSDAGGSWTFSNGNKTASNACACNQTVRGTTSHATGKWYFEVQPTAITSGGVDIGIAKSTAGLGTALGNDSSGYGYYSNTGAVWNSNTGSAYGASYSNTATISVAVDLDNHRVYFAKNGTWQNSANPASGTGGFTISTGTFFAAADTTVSGSGTSTHIINTGGSAFSYSPPSGFSAWH